MICADEGGLEAFMFLVERMAYLSGNRTESP